MVTVELPSVLSNPRASGACWRIDLGDLSPQFIGETLAQVGEIGFSSSGTSGDPQEWWRTSQQLTLEAEATLDILGRSFDAVYTTVPPDTLYGYAAVLIAATLRVPLVHNRWALYDIPIEGSNPVVFTMPIAWRYLRKQLGDYLNSSARDAGPNCIGFTVAHAGASLPLNAYRAIRQFQTDRRWAGGIRAIELFGASETGVMAYRNVAIDTSYPWRTVDDVQLVASKADIDTGEQRLILRGPRNGRPGNAGGPPETVTTGDWIRRIADDTFLFLGRRERIVKVRGSAIDLDKYEEWLNVLFPHLDVACFPILDDVWGEHVEIHVAAPGPAHQAAFESDLLLQIRRHSGRPLVVPRRVVFVPEIKRSGMGKVRRLGNLDQAGLNRNDAVARVESVSVIDQNPLEGVAG